MCWIPCLTSLLAVPLLWPQVASLRHAPNLPIRSAPRHDSCSGWGAFGDDTFTRTSTNREVKNNGDFRFGDFHGVFVHPGYNFAFCVIPKNACSEWTTVLKRMFTGNLTTGRGYTIAQKSHQRFGGTDALSKVFGNPKATRAVFVRDPLARFASAFLDKCGKDNIDCPIHPPPPFSEVVNWALNSDMSQVNGHWALQSSQCGLRTHVREYTVIGYMDKKHLTADAACLLERAGLERFNAFAKGEEMHNSTTTEVTEEDVLANLFTREAALALIKHMAVDYDTFHFDREPAWLARATGKYFNEKPEVHSMMRQSYAVELRDEDDFVTLAKTNGYV